MKCGLGGGKGAGWGGLMRKRREGGGGEESSWESPVGEELYAGKIIDVSLMPLTGCVYKEILSGIIA